MPGKSQDSDDDRVADPNNFAWLCSWYAAQANEEWEHEFGIHLDTLDNPGWTLAIDVAETGLDASAFPTFEWDSGTEWIRMRGDSDSSKIRGACSPHQLETVVGAFRKWVSAQRREIGQSSDLGDHLQELGAKLTPTRQQVEEPVPLDPDVRLWIDPGGGITFKVVTRGGDPVELSAPEARSIAHALLAIADEYESDMDDEFLYR